MTQEWPDELAKRLSGIPPEELKEMASRTSLAAWQTHKRNLKNSWHHVQWCEMAVDETIRRLCVVAPRDHCKSEIFAVNLTAWKTLYSVGHWTYLFSRTGSLADELLERVVMAMEDAEPRELLNPRRWNQKDKMLRSGSRVSTAGVGGAVRGGHPHLIVLDDILDDKNSQTDYQRKKLQRWFTETITPMATPDTRIIVVGTPQHQLDLLMSFLKHNPEYVWIEYPALIGDEDYEDYESGRKMMEAIEKVYGKAA